MRKKNDGGQRSGGDGARSRSGSAGPFPQQVIRFVARFDRREYWLAHEELEELWTEDRDDFYKGLIQLAAAFVHVDRANWNGARRLMSSALDYLTGYPPNHRGFALEEIRDRAGRALAHIEELIHGRRRRFEESLRFRLAPLFTGEVLSGTVEDVELPYRVQRYAEGYRPRPAPGRTSGERRKDSGGGASEE